MNPVWTALDRNVALGRAEEPALVGLSRVTGSLQTLDFATLTERVAKLAGVLRASEVGAGDRGIIWLPEVIEGVIAELACIRLGIAYGRVSPGADESEVAALVTRRAPQFVIAGRGGRFEPVWTVVVRASTDDPGPADGFGRRDVDYRSWTRSTAVQPTEPVTVPDGQPLAFDPASGQPVEPPPALARLAAGLTVELPSG